MLNPNLFPLYYIYFLVFILFHFICCLSLVLCLVLCLCILLADQPILHCLGVETRLNLRPFLHQLCGEKFIIKKSFIEIHQLWVGSFGEFYQHLCQVSPSYTRPNGEPFLSRKFLARICGEQNFQNACWSREICVMSVQSILHLLDVQS